MSANLKRWQGLLLVAAIATSTLWLAMTGQLELYVAPRHTAFATVMAVVGLVAVVFSAVGVRTHEHARMVPRWSAILSAAGTGTALLVAGSLLVLPPATLTSATASQREINSTAVGGAGTTVKAASEIPDSAGFANLTLADWASLLRQTSDVSFYQGKTATALGFITEDPEDPENVFYISRFYITHCALDAQAVGVPIYLEDWKSTFSPDQWVTASGEFVPNRSSKSTQSLVLDAEDIAVIEQPEDPYLYS